MVGEERRLGGGNVMRVEIADGANVINQAGSNQIKGSQLAINPRATPAARNIVTDIISRALENAETVTPWVDHYSEYDPRTGISRKGIKQGIDIKQRR